MGKFDFEIDPAFLRSLGKLSDVDKYAPKMVDAATPILQRSIKAALQGHRRTGLMVDSIKRTRTKKAKNGAYLATVRPTGLSRVYVDKKGKIRKRKTPVRNMEILAHLEYGTKRQAPTPLLTKAVNDCRAECEAAMTEVFRRESGVEG